MCAHYGARKPARALGCEKVRTLVYEDVGTFEREESAHVVVRVREKAHTVYQVSQS